MFKELRLIDENIARIQKELKGSFVKTDVLLKLADQIDAIHAFVQKMDHPDQGPAFRLQIEKNKEDLIDLFGRWQTLFVDAEITQLAEDAQKLSEQSKDPAIKKQLQMLEQKIQTLCMRESLSMENQLMVTLARRFIAKGLDVLHKIPSPSEQTLLTPEELADMVVYLLDIGKEFYNNRIGRGLNLVKALSDPYKSGIFRFFHLIDGSEKDLISSDFKLLQIAKIKMMQAIMAYIKELVQGVFDGNYADSAELELMFGKSGK